MPRVLAAAGLFRDENGKADDFDLQQAYISWIAPIGNGLRLDAGKFMTHHCYEVIDGYDGFNDNATRSFLFGYSAPATHTGVRLGYGFGEKAAATIMVVNGWDNARDNNSTKSIGAQLALTPTRGVDGLLNGMWGPEQTRQRPRCPHARRSRDGLEGERGRQSRASKRTAARRATPRRPGERPSGRRSPGTSA